MPAFIRQQNFAGRTGQNPASRTNAVNFMHEQELSAQQTSPELTSIAGSSATAAQNRKKMARIDDFVNKQKDGVTFVISAQMMRMKPQEFSPLAQTWLEEGGPGFNVLGMPHRTVMDGEFLISRVTVIKTTSVQG